jgi:ABC-type sulfate transport system substrate-binding protein
MTWTYDNTDLSTDLAKVRLDIGDTNTNDQLLTDEEINIYLASYDLAGATLRSAQAAYAKIWRDVDRSNLGMSASRSQKAQQLRDLISDLRARVGRRASPFVGGVSQSSKDALSDDTDLVDSEFKRDRFDKARLR